jgi:hypothetical protein
MTTETPPDWVLLEAAKRADCDVYRRDGAFLALCDMIQKYEKPPVDRKLACARAAVGYEAGYNDDDLAIRVGVRTIELWERGFGK